MTGIVTTSAAKETPTAWRRLMMVLALVMTAWALIMTVLAGELIPEIILFGMLFGVGAYWVGRRDGRAGPIYLVLIAAALYGLAGPFIVEDLAHPESPLGFILFGVVLLVVPSAILLAGVGTLRSWSDEAREAIAHGAAGLFAGLAAFSVGAAALVNDDMAAEGDLLVSTADLAFAPATVQAASGDIGFLVDNQDPFRHTFTIEELGIEVELPASTARRVVVPDVPAGTYYFLCSVSGHESMQGELVVGS